MHKLICDLFYLNAAQAFALPVDKTKEQIAIIEQKIKKGTFDPRAYDIRVQKVLEFYFEHRNSLLC